MNLVAIVLVVFMLTGIASVLYIDYRQKKKEEKRKEAEYQKQLELEQAFTLDKKYEEDSIITIIRKEENQGETLQVSLIDMDESTILVTLGAIVENVIEVSEEDQTKLLVALANLDFDFYVKFCDLVENMYNNEEVA